MQQSQNHEPHIRLIESQPDINGRYTQLCRINETAGDGHFSYVSTAMDRITGQKVCLKVHSPFADDYRRLSFARESEILEELRGEPDIVPIVEPRNSFSISVTSSPAEPAVPFPYDYFSTALADSNLMHYVYTQDVKALHLLDVFGAICRGVYRLHRHSICHRDLKLDNCLLGPGREVWVADFGAACKVDGLQPPLQEEYGQLMFRGDKRYTAPELVCGLELREFFYAGDFYSLGAILFEMFTRASLFTYVFTPPFVDDLAKHFYFVPVAERRSVFEGFLPDLLATKSLPSIIDVDDSAPRSIAYRVDRLYQAMSNLDYRKRLTDFPTVFNEIEKCRIILRNQRAYEAWRRRQAAFPQRARSGGNRSPC